MRNKKTKSATTKVHLTKMKKVCVTYNRVQYAYALKLDLDENITEIRVNVDLEGFKYDKYPDRTYTSDFVCTKKNGELMVRECSERKYIGRPKTVKLLDCSRKYWLSNGVSDWGIVIDAE